MTKRFNNYLIGLTILLAISIAGLLFQFSLEDDANSATITYEPVPHTVNLSWDFGERESCMMETYVESFYNVDGKATHLTPDRFWFGTDLETISSTEKFYKKEAAAVIDCKGTFSYNIGDLEYFDNFTGIDAWTTFYDKDNNILNQLNFGYDEIEIMIVLEDPCISDERAAYFTDYYYAADRSYIRERTPTTGEKCTDIEQNFDNDIVPLIYIPVS